MKLEDQLSMRSGGNCELCQADASLNIYEVPHAPYRDADGTVMICAK